MLLLFVKLHQVEQNGSDTSPSNGGNALSCRNALFKEKYKLFTQIGKKNAPLCTHRWPNTAWWQIHASSCSQRTGYSTFLGTFRPLRAKALTNSGACLFAFSAGALQSQTGRLGFHWQSGRGLVSSVMDRPNRLRAEIPSSFREQEGRTSTSSITLTLTFCALAGGGDEESCPRISSATFFHCHFPWRDACKKYLPLCCNAAAPDKRDGLNPHVVCCAIGCVLLP